MIGCFCVHDVHCDMIGGLYTGLCIHTVPVVLLPASQWLAVI